MSTAQPFHILLVDDDDALREALHLLLAEQGYVVHSAATGAQALQTFHTTPIDLAILDIQMPKMDGYSLRIELRKGRRVPVIFMSALAYPEVRQHALSMGRLISSPNPSCLPP
jgi:CheY-like chemotaxis protein